MSLLNNTHAVVVNWNGGDSTRACIDALVANGLSLERIQLVDNGSTDGSLQALRAAYDGLCVQANSCNVGFARAANQGAHEALDAGADALLFVNNDLVFDEGCLVQLARVLEFNPTLGAVGPRVLFAGERTRLWCAGGAVHFGPNISALLGHGHLDGAPWQGTRAVDYLPGCALLMSRDCIQAVGLFDESYFAYLEDVDLGLRLKAAGRLSLCVGEVACEHAPSSATGGGYSPRRKYLNGRNSWRFLQSHGSWRSWGALALFDVLTLPWVFVVGIPRGRWKGALAKGLGLLHGAIGRDLDPDFLEDGACWLW